ncbi:uncharacterized protein B0J16DRAFT_370009 [Fusarium flagelliforme]|uniref:uncharacterized protein n=1 Tax=Fusarium flagelliforme TaxID=2675880 RepID=UPI001E8DC32D|nr:uncharacterized protein B0J16DRAFT_370009 [Fusarium flagelliforme]KAH7193979.1 hypothetical protein B0J16DRAFT_370009 [Fusarium flagelliforme]
MTIINLPGVALVTGASKGIGRATSLAFAVAGVKGLVLSARNKAELQDTAAKAKAVATNPDFDTLIVLCDISREKDIIDLVAQAVEKFGKIDYAVNNAGLIAQKFIPFVNIPTEEIDELANVNARGSFLCTREEIKVMLKQPRKDLQGLTDITREAERGCIVNVSSEFALGGMPFGGSYGHTTWSRLGMTKTAALEYAAEGIRVNSLLAGYTVTDGFMAHPDATAELGASLTTKNPMKRLAAPGEVADAIIFLCSPLARYITGHGLAVEGGHTSGFA